MHLIEFDDSLLNLTTNDTSLKPIEFLSAYGLSIEQEMSATNLPKHIFNVNHIQSNYIKSDSSYNLSDYKTQQKHPFEEHVKVKKMFRDFKSNFELKNQSKYNESKNNNITSSEFRSEGITFTKLNEYKKCIQKQLYSCIICEKSFSSTDKLKRQMKYNREIDTYKGEYCNYTSENNSTLRKHIFISHKKKRGKRRKQEKDWKKRRKQWEYDIVDLPSLIVLYIMLCCTTTYVQIIPYFITMQLDSGHGGEDIPIMFIIQAAIQMPKINHILE